jgi:hypothetical protein
MMPIAKIQIVLMIFEQAFKTPSPKPKKSLLSSLFGGGSGHKKARVSSFGVNKRMTYTPPDSDATRRMHGINEIHKFDVVITDLPVYKEWRRFHDAEFVKKFNDLPHVIDGKPQGCQADPSCCPSHRGSQRIRHKQTP